jgi:hypothetical protein
MDHTRSPVVIIPVALALMVVAVLPALPLPAASIVGPRTGGDGKYHGARNRSGQNTAPIQSSHRGLPE